MSGTISSPYVLMSTQIVDNSSGQDTPAEIRNVVESLAGRLIRQITSNYTLALTDRGTVLDFVSASAITALVPSNTFLAGHNVGLRQGGTGQLTVSGAAGVTLNSWTSTFTTRAQGSRISVLADTVSNSFFVDGDLTSINLPGPPTNLAPVGVTSTSITFNWSPPTTGSALNNGVYTVQVALHNGTFSTVGTVQYCTPGSGSVTDGFGNTWSIGATGPNGVYCNNVYVSPTNNVAAIYFSQGVVTQQNTLGDYYYIQPTQNYGGTPPSGGAGGGFTGPSSTNPLVFTDSGLQSGQQYDVHVNVANTSGTSTYCPLITMQPSAATAQNKPLFGEVSADGYAFLPNVQGYMGAISSSIPNANPPTTLGAYYGGGGESMASLLTGGYQYTINGFLSTLSSIGLTPSQCVPSIGLLMGDATFVSSAQSIANWQAITNGQYDQHYNTYFNSWKAAGFPVINVRLAWEFNFAGGPWSPYWSLTDWLNAWKHVAELAHAFTGMQVNMVWNPAEQFTQGLTYQQCFPSGSGAHGPYVDFLGIDTYNGTGFPPLGDSGNWTVNNACAFAVQQNIPLISCETGGITNFNGKTISSWCADYWTAVQNHPGLQFASMLIWNEQYTASNGVTEGVLGQSGILTLGTGATAGGPAFNTLVTNLATLGWGSGGGTGGGTGTLAQRTNAFINTIGVNTHLTRGNSAVLYTSGNGGQVVSAMQYLGVNQIRDQIQNPWPGDYNTCAAAGMKFCMLCPAFGGQTVNVSADVAQLVAFQSAYPGSMIAFEGPNEFNQTHQIWNGITGSDATVVSFGQGVAGAYQSAIHAQSSLSGLKLIVPSIVYSGSNNQAVYTGLADAENQHIYPVSGQQRSDISFWTSASAAAGPGMPIWVTEMGSANGPLSANVSFMAGSEQAQGIFNLNFILMCFSLGIAKSFIYELSMENSPNGVQENTMGIYHTDGSPCLGATYLHNTTSLLADTGSNSNSFTLGKLPYSLSGAPSGTASILLEKSDASFWIILWNSTAVIVNQSTGAFAPPSAVNVTVNFGQTVKSYAVYDVTSGTTALKSGTSASSTTVSFSASPILVKVVR